MLHNCTGHKRVVQSVAVSPNGEFVVSGSSDKTVKLWDVKTGRLLHDCTGHKRVVQSVAVSPDGEFVVSGSWDKAVKLWDVKTGRLLHDCTGHKSEITSVTISPGGEFVISGSDDGTVKIWEAESGRLKATFLSAAAEGWMTYTPDGYFIGSQSVVEKVMMKFERSGNQYPAELFPRDNPNPQKVAEALAGATSGKLKPKSSSPRPRPIAGSEIKRLKGSFDTKG
jgi:WD40 repeat protein